MRQKVLHHFVLGGRYQWQVQLHHALAPADFSQLLLGLAFDCYSYTPHNDCSAGIARTGVHSNFWIRSIQEVLYGDIN